MYYAAVTRGISVTTFDDPHLLRMEYKGCTSYTRGSRSRFQSSVGFTIAGDKFLSKQLLSNAGMPAGTAHKIERSDSQKEYWRMLTHIPLPAVLKPAYDTSSGDDVYVNITDQKELYSLAHDLLKRHVAILVERQLLGYDHRIIVIGGTVCAAFKRTPANVIGDGTQTIADLIAHKNTDPLRGDGYDNFLSRIVPDTEMRRHLAQTGKTLETVPAHNEQVFLRGVSNIEKRG